MRMKETKGRGASLLIRSVSRKKAFLTIVMAASPFMNVALGQTSAGCLTRNGSTIYVPIVPAGPGQYNIALTTFNPLQIAVRDDFYELSPLGSQLVLSHECGHAALGTYDEPTAQYYSGQLMCIMGNSRSQLQLAQQDLLSRNLTNYQVINQETQGFVSKCGQ